MTSNQVPSMLALTSQFANFIGDLAAILIAAAR